MPLTDTAVKNARPGPKVMRVADGHGLSLEIAPTGSKRWRYRYRYAGTAQMLSLGIYPTVTLAKARSKALDLRRLLDAGIDPSAHRKAVKHERLSAAANTVKAVALAWHAQRVPTWSVSHGAKILRALERDVFPRLGTRPVADVTEAEVLDVLQRVQARGAIETGSRLTWVLRMVFAHAGRGHTNPALHLAGRLQSAKARHYPAVLDPARIGDLLRACDGYHGSDLVRGALRLAPLVAVRPGELRQARWADIDLDAATWSFTASKTGQGHTVPLSRQAVAVLRDLHARTGERVLVFPSERSLTRPMSDNALNAALRRMGIPKTEMVMHGWRAVFRSIGHEVLHARPEALEAQLAHRPAGPLGAAYARAQFLLERRDLLQRWADWLDVQRTGAKPDARIVAFPGA